MSYRLGKGKDDSASIIYSFDFVDAPKLPDRVELKFSPQGESKVIGVIPKSVSINFRFSLTKRAYIALLTKPIWEALK